jgi:ABC-type dipeptide/oligopeptide/nickel transport system permease subunit
MLAPGFCIVLVVLGLTLLGYAPDDKMHLIDVIQFDE